MTLRILTTTLSFALLSCAAEHPAPPEGPPTSAARRVHIALAREIQQPVADEVVGTARARSVAAVAASLVGRVRSLNVTLGSQVRANQVLIVLSADEIEAKANQARAQLAQAGIELKRAQLLRDSRSIPAAQYDSALAQYAVAEATLAEADVLRGYTTIRAPFAGVITAKHCDVGDLAMPGKPLLVLESPGALRFEASVPETVAAAVQAGAVMQVHIDALRRGLSARVSELSPSADPASRTVSVKLDLPSIAGLRAGMFGRLSVPTGEERALVVPSAALVQRGQMEMLFVVERGRAHLRLVRSGRIHDGQTEVLAGLARGEPVIVAEAHHLSDADLVEVLP